MFYQVGRKRGRETELGGSLVKHPCHVDRPRRSPEGWSNFARWETFRLEVTTLEPSTLGDIGNPAGFGANDYQEAFFTPGMRPAEAISRNWIREMPNWRM